MSIDCLDHTEAVQLKNKHSTSSAGQGLRLSDTPGSDLKECPINHYKALNTFLTQSWDNWSRERRS